MDNLELHRSVAIKLNSQFRTENRAGTDYRVYPVVMLVEGVHHGVGSDPVYYPPSVLEESAPHWNNMPVTIGHPVNELGDHILCNTDGTIRQQWEVGTLHNVHFSDNKLKGEVWLQTSVITERSPQLLSFLDNGGNLDVSTGLLAASDGVEGNWNEEQYSGTITDIVPDHIALLPNQTGACSWDDGCGIRFNKAEEIKKRLIIFSSDNLMKRVDKIHSFVDSLDERDAANEMYIKLHYVRAVYDDYFIYKQTDRTNNTEMLLKQMYSIGANEEIVPQGEPIPVVEEIKYKPLSTEVNANKNKGDIKMANKTEKGCCPKKVLALIANENNAFVEADQEWLESLTEDQLDKLINTKEVQEPEKVDDITLSSFLESAPPEIRNVLNSGLRELDTKRTGLIERIMACETNTFTEETLKAMDQITLESVASLIPPPAEKNSNNFGGMVPASIKTNTQEDVEEPYIPITLSSMFENKKEE